MNTKIVNYEIPFGDTKLEIEIGKLAKLASASVTVKYGETVVLASVVVAEEPAENPEYFPLVVDYEEKWYASGKISGSRFIKREARPSDEAILTSRLIDRGIRPLFSDGYKNDIQIIVTVLSTDLEHDTSVASVIAASLALMISKAPFDGPISAVRLGMDKDGKLMINPKDSEINKESQMDLLVVSKKDAVVMIEAGCSEISESDMGEALEVAFKEAQSVIKLQEKIYQDFKTEKHVLEDVNVELREKMKKFLGDKLAKALVEESKEKRQEMIKKFEESASKEFEGDYKQADISETVYKHIDEEVRKLILEKGIRPDGRKLDDLRELSAEIGLLPRTHGSGLFSRGETQALTVTTLGSPEREQTIETMSEEAKKRYMHHYFFPPFSVGEIRMLRGASRRDIGHGALAEKALIPVLPSKEDFPYTIRVVSEILGSNGSSSMAAVCGSTLSLMDAGVPIKNPVAGISIGLVLEDKKSTKGEAKHVLLTDIAGAEDHSGDMDFKVAGTRNGITAIQLDVKTKKLTVDILREALEKAKIARTTLLDLIEKTISQPKKELSKYAPKIKTIKINPTKIGMIIGPGGKIINQMTQDYGVSIDIEEDGSVFITSDDLEGIAKAEAQIKEITYEPEVGGTYKATIVKIMDFGAFAKIPGGQEGLIHVSQLSDEHVKNVNDVVKVGDEVTVKLVQIDDMGRLNLSIKQAQK